MSKRFGRNQKRRAREEISKLKQKESDLQVWVAMHRSLLEKNTNLVLALKEEISEAKRIAGHMSVMFNPPTVKIHGDIRETVYADAMQPMRNPGDPVPETMRWERIPLDVLIAGIQGDAFDRAIHFRAEFDGNRVAYALAHGAYGLIPRDVLIKRMARALADQMVSA